MLSRTVASNSPKNHSSFSLSNISANLLNVLGDLNTPIKDEMLTYVITLPVFSRETLGVIKLIAISIVLENKKFFVH